jgi:hypothetical protein
MTDPNETLLFYCIASTVMRLREEAKPCINYEIKNTAYYNFEIVSGEPANNSGCGYLPKEVGRPWLKNL